MNIEKITADLKVMQERLDRMDKNNEVILAKVNQLTNGLQETDTPCDNNSFDTTRVVIL